MSTYKLVCALVLAWRSVAKTTFFQISLALCILIIDKTLVLAQSTVNTQTKEESNAGSLQANSFSGKLLGFCTLKNTFVDAEISGFISRVTVTQVFYNPFNEPVEAIYQFPLSQNAAVDSLKMQIGKRHIEGKIKRREEAQIIYQEAKTAGQTVSLLDQERPNVFTQSVANILPNQQVKVVISYVEMLKYKEGSYEFIFPMTVGKRYLPTPKVIRNKEGFNQVIGYIADASKVSAQYLPRSGKDVSLKINIDAGVDIEDIASPLHEISYQKINSHCVLVKLEKKKEIPNIDFILKYKVAGNLIKDSILTNKTEKGGFFALILQPPDRFASEEVMPKELVFVVDTSGSMQGAPIKKAKEVINFALAALNPQDTFNLITFAGSTQILFPKPVPTSIQNLEHAQQFINSSSGSGGTEMMEAINAALAPSDEQKNIRVVCFLTDGYVGNDMEIIAEVKKHPNARVFPIGIGDSVNRFLLDEIAKQGRGEVDYVTTKDDGLSVAKRFYNRVRYPLLTDISINWNGLIVKDVYPKLIPDLFDEKPIIIYGRYDKASQGSITVKGNLAGKEFVKDIVIDLPELEAKHDVLATLWARTKIDDLMGWDYKGLQEGTMHQGLKNEITQLGLKFNLMTQFTSFVAYEEKVLTKGKNSEAPTPSVELTQNQNIYSQGNFYGQTEDFSMWGMIQRHNYWERLISIILSSMALYLIACSIDRFFALKQMLKVLNEQIKSVLKKYL